MADLSRAISTHRRKLHYAKRRLHEAEKNLTRAERVLVHWQQKVADLSYIQKCIGQPSLWDADKLTSKYTTPDLFPDGQ